MHTASGLAVEVMGGLVTLTGLTLLVLPAIYVMHAAQFAASGTEHHRRECCGHPNGFAA